MFYIFHETQPFFLDPIYWWISLIVCFFIDIDFLVPKMIQGFVLNFSLYLLIFWKRVDLMSKEFIALRKLKNNLGVISIALLRSSLLRSAY